MLDTPSLGGNVSLYNETRADDGSLQPIHPTPVVGMVGLVEDFAWWVVWPGVKRAMPLCLLGVSTDERQDDRVGLAGSSYQQLICGLLTGRPPIVDLDLERARSGSCSAGLAQGLLASSP